MAWTHPPRFTQNLATSRDLVQPRIQAARCGRPAGGVSAGTAGTFFHDPGLAGGGVVAPAARRLRRREPPPAPCCSTVRPTWRLAVHGAFENGAVCNAAPRLLRSRRQARRVAARQEGGWTSQLGTTTAGSPVARRRPVSGRRPMDGGYLHSLRTSRTRGRRLLLGMIREGRSRARRDWRPAWVRRCRCRRWCRCIRRSRGLAPAPELRARREHVRLEGEVRHATPGRRAAEQRCRSLGLTAGRRCMGADRARRRSRRAHPDRARRRSRPCGCGTSDAPSTRDAEGYDEALFIAGVRLHVFGSVVEVFVDAPPRSRGAPTRRIRARPPVAGSTSGSWTTHAAGLHRTVRALLEGGKAVGPGEVRLREDDHRDSRRSAWEAKGRGGRTRDDAQGVGRHLHAVVHDADRDFSRFPALKTPPGRSRMRATADDRGADREFLPSSGLRRRSARSCRQDPQGIHHGTMLHTRSRNTASPLKPMAWSRSATWPNAAPMSRLWWASLPMLTARPPSSR